MIPIYGCSISLRPRRVGQLAAPFAGDFDEFGAAFAGDFGEFVAAFPRDVCQFAALLGADLESTAQLVNERAVGERTARRSPDG